MTEQPGQDIALPEVIFLVLNLTWFVILLSFVARSGSNYMMYEQAYAKEIALFVDNSVPYSQIYLDAEDILSMADKNKFPKEEIISLTKDNTIIVKLHEKGGYSYKFYTDAKLSFDFEGNKLRIVVEKKE